MYKIKFYTRKLKEHFDELGTVGGIKWLFFAVRFRTMLFLTKKTSMGDVDGEGNISRKKCEENFIAKSDRKVFIFSMIPYYDIGGGQRPAQVTKAMNMLGYKVYYIFGMHTSESIVYRMEIPTVMHRFVESFSEMDFAKIVGNGDILVVDFAYKKFLPFFEIAKKKGAKIIYENIDNWETSLGSQLFDRESLNKVLRMSDVLVGTADFLVEQLKGYCRELNIKKKIIYNPNAVDDVLFDPKKEYDKPEDFVEGEKTLVYYGSLWGDWFDWDLLYGTAKRFSRFSFIMIGEKENIRNITERAPNNVHFLGIKKQTDLPAYLKYSDYALIPFKVDKIGEAVSPLKIFEYISMNTVVLTTSLPEVTKYPNVLCGDTVDEWEKLLKKKATVDIVKRDEFIDENNWYSRSLQLMGSVKETMERLDGKLSIVILNYNNENCIFECIDSILRHSSGYDYELIVVDNKSTDGSYELLKKNYAKKVKILRNKKNGCSSGRNLGVNEATGKYILFLDSDQFVNRDDWLNQYAVLIRDDKVGAIGWAAGWLKKNKFGFSPIVDDFPYRSMPADMLARKDIDYLGSGGMLLTREVFDKVGGFDERFDPTCYEDTDFSYAIKNAGYEILYCPYLGIYHLPHQTTKSGEFKHDELLEEHRKLFLDKWKHYEDDAEAFDSKK